MIVEIRRSLAIGTRVAPSRRGNGSRYAVGKERYERSFDRVRSRAMRILNPREVGRQVDAEMLCVRGIAPDISISLRLNLRLSRTLTSCAGHGIPLHLFALLIRERRPTAYPKRTEPMRKMLS
jgi:hypothetical protein